MLQFVAVDKSKFSRVESADSLSGYITCYSRTNSCNNMASPSYGYIEEETSPPVFFRAKSEAEEMDDKIELMEEILAQSSKKRERSMLPPPFSTYDNKSSKLSMIPPLSKKNIVSYSDFAAVDLNKGPTNIIPPEGRKNEELPFLELVEDVQLYLLSFCSVQDIKNVQLTCRRLQLFLRNHPHFWKELSQQVWPWCSEKHMEHVWNGFTTQVTNYSSLFEQSSTYHPQTINPSFTKPTPVWSTRNTTMFRPAEFETMKYSLPSSSSNSAEKNTSIQVWQFQGTPGNGDRCIRSDQPFARPHLKKSLSATSLSSLQRNNSRESLLEMLKRKAKRSQMVSPCSNKRNYPQQHKIKSKWTPFVSPFLNQRELIDTSSGTTTSFYELNLAPRMISYFEVSILPRLNIDQEDDNDRFDFRGIHGQEHDRDCVAVGVSTQDFIPSGRMPGWDRKSCGYHSDDGGIFHAKGIMVKQYGPRYGVNDTVGCGVNYDNNGIFYTLNGRFLGYAWENMNIVESELLYPTIGVDTRHPLAVNFGKDRPFLFNFSEFLASSGKMTVTT